MDPERAVSPGDAPMAGTVRSASPADRPSVLSLLAADGLPVMGVSPVLDNFLVVELGGQVVGAVGLELYGPDALLRSAVVSKERRGAGVGGALIRGILARAEARGVRDVYLLTTTAADYFPKFGFHRIERSEVPEAVRQSDEFREACPASAVAMRRTLARP
jgi:amino-acid N-acetyltransferase